ncbi:MAG: adenylosuccinate lyase [Firmicutes bacterium]|nr:adenylosuccinate lyase [Bacillota bacterium]
MIERYQSQPMKTIFSLENRYEKMLKVEVASVEALYKRGKINVAVKQELLSGHIKLSDILEREHILKHDVLAFVESMMAQFSDAKRYFHYGLTSTDVVDSAQSLILKDASHLIDTHMKELLKSILEHAKKYQKTPMMARTHGMYAEMSTLGLRYLRFYEDLNRSYERFNQSLKDVLQVKLSGAVGHYSILPIEHERLVADILELDVQKLSTQVLARDKHASMISHMSILGSVIEDFVLDIRLLSRSDVKEVSEGFSAKQKGSSAMPHKKNPITSENLTGLSRMLRGYVTMAMENIALWHERDISHSSVERVMLEDSFSVLETMILKTNGLIQDLVVFDDHMQLHIDQTYQTTFSQRLLHQCIDAHLDRIESYEHIQKASFEAIQNKTPLREIITNNDFFKPLHNHLNDIFSQETYLIHLVQVFNDLYPKK